MRIGLRVTVRLCLGLCRKPDARRVRAWRSGRRTRNECRWTVGRQTRRQRRGWGKRWRRGRRCGRWAWRRGRLARWRRRRGTTRLIIKILEAIKAAACTAAPIALCLLLGAQLVPLRLALGDGLVARALVVAKSGCDWNELSAAGSRRAVTRRIVICSVRGCGSRLTGLSEAWRHTLLRGGLAATDTGCHRGSFARFAPRARWPAKVAGHGEEWRRRRACGWVGWEGWRRRRRRARRWRIVTTSSICGQVIGRK